MNTDIKVKKKKTGEEREVTRTTANILIASGAWYEVGAAKTTTTQLKKNPEVAVPAADGKVDENMLDDGGILSALREQYTEQTGKQPDQLWGEERLMAEIQGALSGSTPLDNKVEGETKVGEGQEGVNNG